MPRRSAAPKKKRGFMDGYATYDPQVEGYGSAREWRKTLYERMGFEEAERIRNEAKTHDRRTDYQVIGDLAGVVIGENSMWNEIKSAFRKASMNCHPDRAAQVGKDVKVAEEEFKQLTAAYVVLARKYGQD